jgi:fluoride exporter
LKGIEIVLVAVGAIAGALLRFKIAESPIIIGNLPLNVLVINILGSAILGAFSAIASTWNLDSRYSILIAIGFCGSLTTMSSFAFEATGMLDNKQYLNFAISIATNVGLSIGAIIGARELATAIVRAT